ncbi:Hypothetical_protein [Hexamita inflata]|uniref:Hypothetical_protein n=1 Tax=Hexamita inflata TaxID=28002 RepID=A0AA86NV49_9EUKA|nr:Hypothetical protein HINF_LOCUS6753 [Hexamita inflata]CAI9922194.1 Hypothetical protein HINF_LOCUS9839 [Hexamita inflata]CAI9925712.1 Hypothetical protein HINF_LOCUS13357 [Hexamita inflata]
MKQYQNKLALNDLIMNNVKQIPQVAVEATNNTERFLNRVKVMNLYKEDFDYVHIYVDSTVSFKTQFGYNIGILRIIFFKENKPVFAYKCPEDMPQTFANKIAPKIDRGQFQYFIIDNKLETVTNAVGEQIQYFPITCPMVVQAEVVDKLRLKQIADARPKNTTTKSKMITVDDFDGFDLDF